MLYIVVQNIWACFIGYLSQKFDDSISLLKSKLFNKNHQNKNTMKYEKKNICLRVYFSFFFSNVKKIFSRSSLCIRTQRSEIADIHYLTSLIAFSTFIENLWKIIPFSDKNRTNKKWRSIKWKTYCKSTYHIGGPYHLYSWL